MPETLDNEVARLAPGQRVFLPGTSGEILGLTEALTVAPDRAAGVHFIGCFAPGLNAFDYAGLHPDARVTTFLLPGAMHASFRQGRVNCVPHDYFEAARMLAAMPYDTAFAHVAPPDADGLCSLGIASDFAPLAWPGAKRRVLVVNHAMPAMRDGPRLRLADADQVIETEMPLVSARAPDPPGATVEAIAAAVAGLVPDGAAIETGIGAIPGAIWKHLSGHRDILIRTGMIEDKVLDIAGTGALAATGHMTGIVYGTRALYDHLAATGLFAFATTRETHDVAALGRITKFHAINSALEIDLFGQVNLEWQGGAMSSGVGGGPNFVRGALASPGGRSVIALPATARKGTISRIVARIDAPAVSTTRIDADTFVTEHGIAQVRDLDLDRRAEAIIAIAAPEYRATLQEDWARLRAAF